MLGMFIIILYISSFYGEASLATRSSCALPPPIEFYAGGECYIVSVWIVFLSFLAIMPLYNHLSGFDLLKTSESK
ncbi:MAG: hypothetical protein QW355_02140 [Sulfolobales archaeon]